MKTSVYLGFVIGENTWKSSAHSCQIFSNRKTQTSLHNIQGYSIQTSFFYNTTRELSYQIQIISGDIFDLIIFQKKQLQQTFLKQLQKSEFWHCI